MNANIKNLYVHIPFCKRKCHYCSFVSYTSAKKYFRSYFHALKQEIAFLFKEHNIDKLETLYIGGGTPSIVDISFYEELFSFIKSKIKFSETAEITMEINPATVDVNYLNSLKKLGINRLSIGIQSFNDKILHSINRLHSSEDAINTVKQAQNAGFNNISIDLIYGLPGQNKTLWTKDLEQAVSIGIQHISTYGLKIEEGTVFAKKTFDNLPDDELNALLYLDTIDFLEKNGFKHYEISNFAQPGMHSNHNLCYWNNSQYIGVGVSAHGYINKVRYSNTEKIETYISNPLQVLNSHKVSEQEELEEAIFLGLRLVNGINLSDFTNKYKIDIQQKYEKVIDKYINQNLLAIKNGNLVLTKEGILVSNNIFCDFID